VADSAGDAIEKIRQNQSRVHLLLGFFKEAIIIKEVLKSPNAAVADLMFLQTPASEVKVAEQWMIDSKCLKLLLNSKNPVSLTRKRHLITAAYA
jgi:hypothetical protein